MIKVSDFDPSAYLDSEETIAEYLSAALEEDSPPNRSIHTENH